MVYSAIIEMYAVGVIPLCEIVFVFLVLIPVIDRNEIYFRFDISNYLALINMTGHVFFFKIPICNLNRLFQMFFVQYSLCVIVRLNCSS